ncbi:hypothetical protein FRC11_006588 [Ceratobasidium sp. 423]|nr:hypothetical protein FRC11_006588 [Ceratobasidium sp. 423]
MDEAGYHARRRAAKQDAYYQQHPQVGSDGRYLGVETVSPLNEPWVGGFQAQGRMPHAQTQESIPVPPYIPQTGYPPEPGYHPPTWIPEIKIPGATYTDHSPYPGASPHPSLPMSAVERADALGGPPRMDPHLQMMCGPLLRYDTVDDHGIWHGAAMVVTADAGSQYDPHPMLHLEWDPLRPVHINVNGHQRGRSLSTIPSPISAVSSSASGLPPPMPYPSEPAITSQKYPPSHAYQQTDIPGHEIWVYRGSTGSFTFWRFLIQIPLGPNEMGVRYRVNMGQELEFFVPGLNQNMRWAAYSCNGFSAGVNQDDFRGSGHATGYDPLWKDLLDKHAQRPFHALVGGGDQLYCDASIPMVNMLDDHDLIDGFGSYPDNLQLSPIFRAIGSRGYFFFLLFQCFTVGPQTRLLLLDCRAERKKDLVCSQTTYDRMFRHLHQLPQQVEHVVVQLGIPIAYPRMNFLETALESKLNPFTVLAQKGTLGLSGFVNKFNKDPELLDDLNDHWTAKSHKRERNWFIEQVQAFAKARRIRVTFLSGDVHCAAVGYFKTLARGGGKAPAIDPLADHRYMLNVVSSAIVNTPPPVGVLTMVGMLADRPHKTMHYCDTDESMIPLFRMDTDGTPLKQPYIMGRRNYASVELDEQTGHLNFDIRIEKTKGVGETVGYLVQAPPPRWV